MFRKRRPTVGEALLHAKQGMMKEPAAGDQQRAMLDAMAAVVSPAAKQMAEERAEHVLMFNLIGDPLLRLRYPEEIKVEAPKTAAPGEPLKVAGSTPVEGRGTVELVVRRGRLAFKPPVRREYPQTAAGLAEFQEVYCQANDQRLVSDADEDRRRPFRGQPRRAGRRRRGRARCASTSRGATTSPWARRT